ncbi:hypothetical protein GOD34_29960 [Sinorhizobium medicae]|nr:hypothetical protein [Sinorhizobium medicae]MDX1115543.1 hypothetical protein [Sinorhizobium medicae]
MLKEHQIPNLGVARSNRAGITIFPDDNDERPRRLIGRSGAFQYFVEKLKRSNLLPMHFQSAATEGDS